jgi:hypothetical protein
MHRLVPIFIVLATVLFLQGCLLLNSTEHLWDGDTPFLNRTTIVYGVDVNVDASWRWIDVNRITKTFGVSLAEYNLEKQKITGNCWRYNTAEALVSSDAAMPQYFAFDVPDGYFAFDWPIIEPSIAFAAPKGRVVYIGTLVYTKNMTVELHRDLEKEKSHIFSALPKLPKNIELADTVPVTPPRGFLCVP